MTFVGAKVGDELGVKSTNSNALEYYRYASCTVLEVHDDQLVTTRGAFMKHTGCRPPGTRGSAWHVLVSKAEKDANNLQYRNSQRSERLKTSIKLLTDQLGDSDESVAVLDQVNNLLRARVAAVNADAATSQQQNAV